MRIGAVIMLVVALVLGGLSVFAARNWIERQIAGSAAANKPQLNTVKIVVARTQLNFGDKIKDEHLTEVTWPKASVPKGSFRSVRQLLDGKRPRVALRRIEINEPLLKSKVSGFGGRATLSAVLKGDRRAVTIRVNDVTGVAGFLLPGDRVDILMTRKQGKSDRRTGVLLQDLRILGVGQLASERHDKPVVVRTVTVEATPDESQKLILAQQVGTLSMVLRPVTERTVVSIRPVTVSDLTRDQSDPTRLNPPKPGTKKKAAKVATLTKKLRRLPRRDPSKVIGIHRGLKYSRQRVMPERDGQPRSGFLPTPGAAGDNSSAAPTPKSKGIPVPSDSLLQSGMAPDAAPSQP
ncbi:MAG: Flp pilus assembly protein CpaB [Alphaproteobacteria bacterium]|nr:Flp pilus assembly protein CpaB [Alphaproteobacteria bacterium]